jgi:spermidine synthase
MLVRRVFLALSACSGAAVLVYYSVWARLLTLALGHTAIARATTDIAFVGGLAIGAALVGRRVSSLTPRSALARSAFLELFVALAALIIWPALTLAQPLLTDAYGDGEGGALFFALRALVCLVLVTLPAIAIGAMFPLRIRWFEAFDLPKRQSAGTLYAMQFAGAAFGASVTAFLLLPLIGLARTTLSGVALNVIVAAGFLWLRQSATTPFAPRDQAVPPRSFDDTARAASDNSVHVNGGHGNGHSSRSNGHGNGHANGSRGGGQTSSHARPRPVSAAIALALSGFITLTYAVAWTRLLGLTLGPTPFVQSLTIAVFLLGLSAGAAVAARMVSRVSRPLIALAATQMLAAVSAFLVARSVPSLPAIVVGFLGQPHAYPIILLMQAAIAGLLLLPMAIALGATFPFGVATAAPEWQHATSARAGAQILASNLAGAIGGAIMATFVFVPQFGLQRTMLLGGLMGALSGVELTWRSRKRDHMRIWMTTAGVLTAALGLTLRPWNPKVIAGGPYRYAGLSPSELQVELDAGTLLFHHDGPDGTVAVRRVAGDATLSVDGAVAASTSSSMLTEKLLAHVPLLLHPSPTNVCVLGLGSGVTVGAALAHPVDRVDAIEPSRDAARAAELFAAASHQALTDPRTHVIVGDSRAHLRLAHRTYDVIVSAPPNPWVAGAAPLFTRELFEAARDRLNPDGLFCQWTHANRASQGEVQSIIATFADVFPGGSLWLVGDRDVLLVGGREPIEPRLGNVSRAWLRPGVAQDLAQVDVRDPFSVLSLLAAQGPALATLGADAARQTDDLAALELSAPRNLYEQGARTAWLTRSASAEALRPQTVVETEDAAGAIPWRNRAVMLLRADAPGLAYDAAARSLDLDAVDPEALSTLSRAATALERQPDALRLLEALVARTPNGLAPLVELSRLRAATGQTGRAIEAATNGTRQFPDLFGGWDQLASMLVRKGDVAGLAGVLEHMHADFGDRWETNYYEGTLHLLRGEFGAAARLGEQVLNQHPTEPRALNLTGSAYAALGVRDRAREAFEASLTSEPRDPVTYVTLGRFELDTFNPQRAAALFTEALFLDPRSTAALNGLADALSRMGRHERAAELRARAGTF